jgi:hypothetical protein
MLSIVTIFKKVNCMEKLQQMMREFRDKYQDGWIIRDRYVDVKLSRRKRHQRVYMKREGGYYTFRSVVMGSVEVTESNKTWNELALMAWDRNANHEIVSFAFDKMNRLVGVIRHPAEHLDPEELELYITVLTFECDRFEYLISGSDRF